MQRLRNPLFNACLAGLAAAGAVVATAAEESAPGQELVNTGTLENIAVARWSRLPDSYVLRLVLDTTKPARTPMTRALSPFGGVTGGNAAQAQRVSEPPVAVANTAERERASFFVGNSIANLRGMDPTFCGRTLTLVDGRRNTGEPGQQPPASRPRSEPRARTAQPYLGSVREPRVEVWLLKADGTQIKPATYLCDPGPRLPDTGPMYDISYGFTAAEGAQAIAAGIRIDGDFFIEKLQPAEPAAQ
jgi:hypothetical protein